MAIAMTQDPSTNSPVLDLLDCQERVEIIGTFIQHPIDEFTKTEIARPLDVDRNDVATHLAELLTYGLVEKVKTDVPSAAPMYRLDLDSDIAEKLLELDEVLFRERGRSSVEQFE